MKDNPALNPFEYGAMRRSKEVLAAVEDGLLVEQGGICAYTGRRITRRDSFGYQAGFHIEHLKPQKHFKQGEDTDYENLTEYGAVKKGHSQDLRRLSLELEAEERALDDGEDVTLDPFCFAIRQAVEQRIMRNGIEMLGLKRPLKLAAYKPALGLPMRTASTSSFSSTAFRWQRGS